MEAFFQIKSFETLNVQLRARLRQVDELLSHIATWSQGVALLATTLDGLYSMDSEYTVGAANEVFAIVQKAVQSGPLRRSKPAYFRKASLDTIETALVMLKTTKVHEERIGLTPSQQDTLAKWIHSAKKYRMRILSPPQVHDDENHEATHADPTTSSDLPAVTENTSDIQAAGNTLKSLSINASTEVAVYP